MWPTKLMGPSQLEKEKNTYKYVKGLGSDIILKLWENRKMHTIYI